MLLGGLRRWLHRPKPCEIPLELLSRLWMTDEDRGRSPSIQERQGPEAQWSSQEVNSFYGEHVRPYFPSLGPARPVIERILRILDEQGRCLLSEPGSDEDRPHATLRESSMNVARKILILSLGQLLGRASRANILRGTPAKSILILEPLIRDLPYRDSIIEAVRTYGDNRPKSDEAKILKAA